MQNTITAALLTSLIFAGIAFAAPVSYIEQGTYTGTFGGTTFTNALVTFIFTGDTANIVNVAPGQYHNVAGLTTVSVAGIAGTGTFPNSVGPYITQSVRYGLISDLTAYLAIAFVQSNALGSYALDTSLASVSGPSFVANIGHPFATTLGALTLNSTAGNGTFSAVVSSATPEPFSGALAGTGLAIICAYRRRAALAGATSSRK